MSDQDAKPHRHGWHDCLWFCVVVSRFLWSPYPFRRVRDIGSIIGVAWAAMWYLPDEPGGHDDN